MLCGQSRGPLGFFLEFVWLKAEVSTGAADVSGDSDLAPTQPEREVFELLDRQLGDARQRCQSLYEESVPAFNRAIATKGIAGIRGGATPPGGRRAGEANGMLALRRSALS